MRGEMVASQHSECVLSAGAAKHTQVKKLTLFLPLICFHQLLLSFPKCSKFLELLKKILILFLSTKSVSYISKNIQNPAEKFETTSKLFIFRTQKCILK